MSGTTSINSGGGPGAARRLPVIAALALAALAGSSCGRGSGGRNGFVVTPTPLTKKDRHNPDSPEARGLTGKPLPPPPDAEAGGGAALAGEGGDVTAPLLANLAERQDDLEKKQEKLSVEARNFQENIFLPFAKQTQKSFRRLDGQLAALTMRTASFVRQKNSENKTEKKPLARLVVPPSPASVVTPKQPGATAIKPPGTGTAKPKLGGTGSGKESSPAGHVAVRGEHPEGQESRPVSPPPATAEQTEQPVAGGPTPAEATPPPEAPRQRRSPRHRRAYTYRPEGLVHLRRAANAYRTIIRDYPGTEEADQARRGLAQIALKQGEIEKALNYYEAVVREWRREEQVPPARPRRPDPRILLEGAKLLVEAGRFKEARAWLRMMEKPRCLDEKLLPKMWMERARSYTAEADKTVEALAAWEDVSRRFPGTETARSAQKELAAIYVREKRYEEAAEAYRVLAEDPQAGDNRDFARLRRAWCFLQIARTAAGDEHRKWEGGERPRLYIDKARAELEILHEKPRLETDYAVWAEMLAAEADELDDLPYDAARRLAKTADEFPTSERWFELRRRAAEDFAACGGHLPQAAAQYRAFLVRSRREPLSKRRRIEPPVLFALAVVLRKNAAYDELTGNDDLLEARGLLDELEGSYPDSPKARAAGLERAELLIAHAERAGRGSEKRLKNYRAARDLLRDFAARHVGTPLGVRAEMRKAELEEKRGLHLRSLLTFEKLDPTALEEEDPAGAHELRYEQAVRRMELGEKTAAYRALKQLAGDPEVDSLLRAKAAYQAAFCLYSMGRLPAAVKAFDKFIAEYEHGLAAAGKTKEKKGEEKGATKTTAGAGAGKTAAATKTTPVTPETQTAENLLSSLVADAHWYMDKLTTLTSLRKKVLSTRKRLRKETP